MNSIKNYISNFVDPVGIGFKRDDIEDSQPPNYQEIDSRPGPSAALAPPTSVSSNNLSREQCFAEIVNKYEISMEYANRLQLLKGFKIVYLIDDSSSMNSMLRDSPLNKPDSTTFATRWNEAEYFATISIQIGNIFDREGCDVYFLNHQPPIRNIKSVESFLAVFLTIRANGYTPLSKAVSKIFQDNALTVLERRLLLIVLTDGEPTDETGRNDVPGFKRCLKRRNAIDRTYISIIACTDQTNSMSYLNMLDRRVKNLDVVDDFRNEKIEVRKAKGSRFSFTYGDYVVKSMIGSLDKSFDRMDEGYSGKCNLL